MAKKRLIKSYPRMDRTFETVAEVQEYLRKLVRALEENRPRIFMGDVILGTTAPSPSLGKDGDLYIKS